MFRRYTAGMKPDLLPIRPSLAGLALAALLSLSACGGGGGDSTPPAAPPVAVTPPTTPPVTPPSTPATPTTPSQDGGLHVTILAGAQYSDDGPGQFVNGAAANARFYRVSGLAMDKAGNVFVADAGNCAIRKITPAGMVSTLAGGLRCATPEGDPASFDGSGGAAAFYNMRQLVIDASDNLYVIDGAAIRKITPQGVVSTLAGQLASSEPIADGAGKAARFYRIEELAVEPNGTLLVRDATLTPALEGHYMNCADTRDFNYLREISPQGVVTTLKDTAVNCSKPENPSLLSRLASIRIARDGTLYAWRAYGLVKRPPGGAVAWVLDAAGNNVMGRYDYAPRGLAPDDFGNVYSINQYDFVEKYTADGTMSQVLVDSPGVAPDIRPDIPMQELRLLTYVGNHDFLLSVKNQIVRVTFK